MRTTLSRSTLICLALCFGMAQCATAAKPGLGLTRMKPVVTDSATPFNPSFAASNVLDDNKLTEYASQSLGTGTFIDFDFGASVDVTHFHHQNRNVNDQILQSQLTFSDTSDFSVVNVVANSHSAKPLLYKITGVWGNHEGSMLLWILILALFGCAVAVFGSNLPPSLRARVLGVQAWISIGFAVWIISFVIGAAYYGPQGRKLDAEIADGGVNSPAVRSRLGQIRMVGWIEMALLVIVVWAMVAKPGA